MKINTKASQQLFSRDPDEAYQNFPELLSELDRREGYTTRHVPEDCERTTTTGSFSLKAVIMEP